MRIKSPLVVSTITAIVVILSQLACGTFQVIVLNPNSSYGSTGQNSLQPTANRTELTPTQTPSADQTHPPLNTPTDPWFSPRIAFYTDPDPQKSQRVFPSGIRQIFAIWDYANMKPGLLVRREWYKDGELFLAQEDHWDFSRYGSQGTIADITIHDFEKGLEKGLYSLHLFINGQEQTLNTLNDQASFRIIDVKPPLPSVSPDGSRIALVPDPQSLVIQMGNGLQDRVFIGQEIVGTAWFPDNQNIIVSNRDRTKQDISGTAEGIRDELWIIDTNSGLRIRIATPEENLHMPLISPDGHYVAAISGTGKFNACESDLSVVLLELDNNLTREAIHRLNELSGLPEFKYPPIPVNNPTVPLPGVWQDPNNFNVALKFPCSSGEDDGIYRVNLESWQMERLK